MPIDMSTSRSTAALPETADTPAPTATPTRTAPRRNHDDAPDTLSRFQRLAELPPGPRRDAVRDDLVTAWLPMAHRIAGRFRDRGESLEDLRQVAALGLVKAVDRFDPSRGAFESYAVPTITGEIKRHFRDRMWALRVPRRVQELRNKVRVARRELTQNPGAPEPSVADIAGHTGLTEEEVAAGLEALESFSTLSSTPSSRPATTATAWPTPSAGPTPRSTSSSTVSPPRRLRRLPERERAILYMRFFEDMTQSRIADKLGISQMHVSRLISRSCARVREEALGRRGAGSGPVA